MDSVYIMFKFPKQDYAQRYCNQNNLLLGNRYYIEEFDKNSVIIKSDKSVLVGKVFFKEHFKIDLRTINLNKII